MTAAAGAQDRPRPLAPEIPAGLTWHNTDRPLSLKALRGRVVVLDFWTYCCINCIHVLPDLAAIEERFIEDPVVVIGVHSAKFDNEGIPENVRQAVLRYGIRHPVVVDQGRGIWRDWGIRSWPTLVVVDTEGRVYGRTSGEGKRQVLIDAVETCLAEGAAKGTLAENAWETAVESLAPGPLRFPGKVVLEEGRILIADSGHHRLVVTDRSGTVKAIVGSGSPGRADGDLGEASFNDPQGLAARGDLIWVADRANHLIRRIDLEKGAVTTIAGTGARAPWGLSGGRALDTPLASPWALAAKGDVLFIANAGSHQLWRLEMGSSDLGPYAGSGREGLRDGARTGSWLAQPSGLAITGGRIWFADSEVSALRSVGIGDSDEEVETLVGTGLFDFGFHDGAAAAAQLQHPLGVAALADGRLVVADTYNHRLRLVDPAASTVTTVLGDGTTGPLWEPGGVSVHGTTIAVADTNHHRILMVRLDPIGGRASTRELAVTGLSAPR